MSGSCIPVLSLFIVPVSRQHCQGNGCGCTSVLSPFIVIVSRQHCQGLAAAVPLYSHHSLLLSPDNIVKVWWLYLCTLTIHCHCLQTTLSRSGSDCTSVLSPIHCCCLKTTLSRSGNDCTSVLSPIYCHCLQTTMSMSGGCTSVLSFIIIVFRQHLSRSDSCTSVLSPFIVIVCRQHCQCLAAVSL